MTGDDGAYDAKQDADELMTDIQEMLDSGDFQWARDTLEGIYDNVSETGRATDRQHRAVENIRASVERRRR